jgi:hypothetical protein
MLELQLRKLLELRRKLLLRQMLLLLELLLELLLVQMLELELRKLLELMLLLLFAASSQSDCQHGNEQEIFSCLYFLKIDQKKIKIMR